MKRSADFPRGALLAPLLAALVLAGCATVPDVPALTAPPPAQFKEEGPRWTIAAPAEAQDRGAWWKAFADPVLDALAERAAVNNTSIQEAAARLAQARALRAQHRCGSHAADRRWRGSRAAGRRQHPEWCNARHV